MRIVYMGSPQFAVPPLQALLAAGHEIPLCISQPDKSRGRSGATTPTAVKTAALEQGIPVLTPTNVNAAEVVAQIAACAPDLLVVTAFGQILKEPLLQLAPLGAINIHASLLPAYRGAAPIQWSLINGEEKTGVTTMFMARGMDTGDMILQREIPILPQDNNGTLHVKLAAIGAELILETLDLLVAGRAPRTVQSEEQATYAPRLLREHERIDWQKSAVELANLIRGLAPTPAAYAVYHDLNIKICAATAVAGEQGAAAGSVLAADKKGITIACGTAALYVTKLQPAGKKEMQAADFWRGQKVRTDFQ